MGPAVGLCGERWERACPRLARISMERDRGEELVEVAELAAALGARPKSCVKLKAICAGPICRRASDEQAGRDALKALLSRLSPYSLEEFDLKGLGQGCLDQAIVPLLTSGCAALKTLKLSFIVGRAGEQLVGGDGLLHALAGGVAPCLTTLDLYGAMCSDVAWRALGEAMGPTGTCLRRLKTLGLRHAFQSLHQLEIFSRAVGAGHGCPELETLTIAISKSIAQDGGVLGGAALAHALRPPRGLPRLKELAILHTRVGPLDQLAEALEHRPHALQPVEKINIFLCQVANVGSIRRAMGDAGSLAGLKELVTFPLIGGDGEWDMELVEALAGGAGQRLEKIICRPSVFVANRLLEALATQGACPRLQALYLARVAGAEEAPAYLDGASLGQILAGRAPCSETLRDVRLVGFSLRNEGVRTLATCLREPGAVQLQWLLVNAREPDCAASVMELLSALQGVQAAG